MKNTLLLLFTAGVIFIVTIVFSAGHAVSGPEVSAQVFVDFTRVVGNVARLSGVQGSPFPTVTHDVVKTRLFRDCSIELSRFPQDCYPNTLTLAGIFPDAVANPDDPGSYHFEAIDRHIRAAKDAGSDILWQSSYDIGMSDSWVDANLGGKAPRDLARWGRVVTKCLQHFNNRWAGGIDHSVKYVEFVNEPLGLGGYRGRGREAISAFIHFLKTIERYNSIHPDTRVDAAGPGIPHSFDTWTEQKRMYSALLDEVRKEKAELPVFTFHTYGKDTSPLSNARLAKEIRALLDEKGFTRTRLWNSEWQAGGHIRAMMPDRFNPRGHNSAEERSMFNLTAATYALSCKARWQGILDGSCYYRADLRAFPDDIERKLHVENMETAILFPSDSRVTPLAMQEKLMKNLRKDTPERCYCRNSPDDSSFTCLACRSTGGDTLTLLLCNLSLQKRSCNIRARFSEGDRTEAYVFLLSSLEGRAREERVALKGVASSEKLCEVTVPPLDSALLLYKTKSPR
ncbi:MAG: hypothetical protein AB2L14_34400 [Candidatus Xenobiia bacterium LiM19]